MNNLKELRLDILLFLTILFLSILICKATYTICSYIGERRKGKEGGEDEADESFNNGAFLDDTTTDIEKYLKSK